MNRDELKKKFMQLFVLGYSDVMPDKKFFDLVENGIGGIIFFAENLKCRKDFKLLVNKFKAVSSIPLFLSTDQEGGLVERTVFLDEKVEYLTQKALSRVCAEDLVKHYDILCKDLADLGINLNFSPVLDVNSNPDNPIIGIRAFGDNPETVNKCADIVLETYKKNNIISCGKHFAGHGDTSVDSHLNMPEVSTDVSDFYNKHLNPFINAVKKGVDTIMVSHVYFPFFNEVRTPASLSANAVDVFLKKILGFKGIVFSDDMVMGGITKNYGIKESIILAVEAGIDSLILRNVTQELLNAIDEIVDMALIDENLFNKINSAYEKIVAFKKEKIVNAKNNSFDLKAAQSEIDKIAQKTLAVVKNGNLLKIPKDGKVKIISFDNKKIFNLSNRKHNLGYLVNFDNVCEINYPVNPGYEDINKIASMINTDDVVIFISYNAHINKGQVELFKTINAQKILVSSALDCDVKLFDNAESIISLASPTTPSLKALAKLIS